MKIERALALVRDCAIWAAGVYGIVHQELTGVVKIELLIMYMAVLAVPGGIGIMTLLRGGAFSTQGLPSPVARQESSPSPSSSGQDDA